MNKPFFKLLDLWKADETYLFHRIPGMIVTSKGTLLAYCEARKQENDWATMDILLVRSENHGESFGEPIILANGNEAHPTVNNPVMVEDKNGRIHFLYCEDYSTEGGRVLRRFSDDDGCSWSEPIDITDATVPAYRNAFALGPGHGITTPEGVIVIPVWMVPKRYRSYTKAHTPSVLSTLYSKDCGETWQIGDILDTTPDVLSPNETVAALTSDGRVYLSIRHLAFYRAKAYSKTGYSDWTAYGAEYALSTPQCFSSVAAYDDGVHPYTLIYAGCTSQTSRTHVSVFASTTNGESFGEPKLLDGLRGGYTELAVDNKNGLIYVLYEDKFGTTDHLATFNYEWLAENPIS